MYLNGGSPPNRIVFRYLQAQCHEIDRRQMQHCQENPQIQERTPRCCQP